MFGAALFKGDRPLFFFSFLGSFLVTFHFLSLPSFFPLQQIFKKHTVNDADWVQRHFVENFLLYLFAGKKHMSD